MINSCMIIQVEEENSVESVDLPAFYGGNSLSPEVILEIKGKLWLKKFDLLKGRKLFGNHQPRGFF